MRRPGKGTGKEVRWDLMRSMRRRHGSVAAGGCGSRKARFFSPAASGDEDGASSGLKGAPVSGVASVECDELTRFRSFRPSRLAARRRNCCPPIRGRASPFRPSRLSARRRNCCLLIRGRASPFRPSRLAARRRNCRLPIRGRASPFRPSRLAVCRAATLCPRSPVILLVLAATSLLSAGQKTRCRRFFSESVAVRHDGDSAFGKVCLSRKEQSE